MMRHSIMIQGTTSDAGKSMLVTALCRWLKQRGVAVAPFKPQNMALNSAVSVEGGEIGRAQAVQAMACGIAASTAMNPILLKPNSDTGSQIIVNGKSIGNMNAAQYHCYKPSLLKSVTKAFQSLLRQYRFVVVEGAGSPAEINLREHDIANMGFAEAVDCPVLLIADIDRGGVFAHIVGTLDLLSNSERQRVLGIVINRFRGDIALLQPGIDWLQQKTGKPVLGVLPYLNDLYLEAEDSLANRQLQQARRRSQKAIELDERHTTNAKLQIAVIALPKISNHTDFDALQHHACVDLHFVEHPDVFNDRGIDVVIIPGSKNTRHDLQWMLGLSWREYLLRHLRYGGKVIGICGGFQMLGQQVHDPQGVEAEPGSSKGLGLMDIETVLGGDKQLRNVKGKLSFADARVQGYEIHVGETRGPAMQKPAMYLEQGSDGAISADDQIFGSYVHGLFDTPQAANAILHWCGLRSSGAQAFDMAALREQSLDRLADMLEQHMDMDTLSNLLEIDNLTPHQAVI